MLRLLKNLRVPLSCFGTSLIMDAVAVAIDHALDLKAIRTVLVVGCISMLPMAVMLYWLRCVHRLAYGVFEFVVAFGVMYFIVLGMVYGTPSSEITTQLITGRTLTLFAVVYFMVRAMDNIGEGLRPGTRLAARWNDLFPKPLK